MRRDSLELPEILFTAIFIPIAAFSWVGILLAEFGAFNGWRVLAGGSLLSLLAFSAARRDCAVAIAARAPVSRRAWIFLAIIVATAAALFSKPGEYVIEGADASVYLSIGRNIAKTGGISSTDPIVGLMPKELQPSFFAPNDRNPDLDNRLPGGLRIGSDGGIHPDFFHLLPVWIAMADAVAGPYGGYFVNVVFAVLSVIVVWLIGRRVWSPAAGGVAAALLAVNFGQIYYARLASSEMLAQFLLLSGAFFTVLVWDSRQRVAGASAGVAIGLAAFTRIDLLLLMVPLAVLWLLQTRSGQLGQAWRWYATSLTLLAGHAAVHSLTVSALYTHRLYDDSWKVLARLQAQMDATTLVAAALMTALAAVAIKKLRRRWLAWAALGVGLTLILLSPVVVVTASRLLSPVGLAVAVAGLGVILTRPLNWRVLPVLVPFLAGAALMLAWRETSILPADFRRAVPAVLPGAMLLIGFVVGTVANSRGWPSAAVWLLPLGLGGWYLAQTEPILRTPPGRHIHAQVAQLAEQLPPGAVVLTDRSVPGHLALALQYTFGRSALRMDARPIGDDGIEPLVERLLAAGRPVFAAIAPLVADRSTGLRRSDVARFDMHQAFAMTMRYDVVVPVRGLFPRRQRVDEVPITLYRITARDTAAAARPLTIDIGDDDFSFVIRGFHEPESFQLGKARWTTGESLLALPRIEGSATTGLTIVLRLSAHRPPGMAPPAARLSVDDVPIGAIPVTTSGVHEYRLALPEAILARVLAGPTMLTISTGSFIPKAVGFNDDGRQLGILLDWIRIE
jgi:hypothetical protein